MLFSFQVFGYFFVIFWLLISGLILLWLVNTALYDLNSLKFVEACFIYQDMIYPGQYSLGSLKKCVCILQLLGEVFYTCQLEPAG